MADNQRQLIVNRLFGILLAAAGLLLLVKIDMGIKRSAAVGFVFVWAAVIHWQKSGRDSQYAKRLLGLAEGKPMMYEYDWLRFFAAAMVILTHACQVDAGAGFVQGETADYWIKVFYMVCLACNCIYIMLMGALLLPYREESLSKFYLRRMVKVGVPMAVYYVFYLWQHQSLQHLNFETLCLVVKILLIGDTTAAPHYWLIYTILSLYLVTPFLRCMMKVISYRMLTGFVILSWIYMGLSVFSPWKIAVEFPMNLWIGVAVMGYWITRPETRKYDRLLMAAGVGAFIVILLLVKYNSDFIFLSANCSPIMTTLTCGMFSFVLSAKRWFGKRNRLIRIISQYSYPVILLHWWTLHFITQETFALHVNQYFYIGGLAAVLVVTLAISWIVAFFIDNLVVLPADTAVNWIVSLPGRIKKMAAGVNKKIE